jgi:hypothetical protein
MSDPLDTGIAVDAQASVGDSTSVVATEAGGEGGTHAEAGCTGVLCPCDNASDCATRVCAQSITVGPTVYGAAGGTNFCSMGCCTSADCPAGTVCFASGQGGQYCVKPEWLGRSTPSAVAGGGGTACSTGADCRSGICAGSACADTCCSLAASSVECANGAACAFGAFPGKAGVDTHFAPLCATATLTSGSSGFGAACQNNAECQGGLCYQTGSGGNCTNPCRTQDECGAGNACQVDAQGNDLYAACFPWQPAGPQGSACTTDNDCRGDWCGTTNQCAGICFTDADCTVSGWHCIPQASSFPMGNYLLLACGP